MLRSVYRQKMPLSCLDLTVREAHLGQWSQDPKTGRTYERKRSEHAARAILQVGGRPHMNRAAKLRLGLRRQSLAQYCVARRRHSLSGPAVISFRRRYHCPELGCLFNRSRDCRLAFASLRRRRPLSEKAGACGSLPLTYPSASAGRTPFRNHGTLPACAVPWSSVKPHDPAFQRNISFFGHVGAAGSHRGPG